MKTLRLLFILLPCIFIACKDKGPKVFYESGEYQEWRWEHPGDTNYIIVDTFCINETKRAKRDIAANKLVCLVVKFYGVENLKAELKKFNIETKVASSSCLIGPFNNICYYDVMYNEILKRYGDHFIDSLSTIAQRDYVIAHPDVEYIEGGMDVREKYGVMPK